MPPSALRLTAQGVVDANGLVYLVFDAVPQGMVFTGTITAAGGGQANWQVLVGIPRVGTSWGRWVGNSPFGPVQAQGRETITVVGSGAPVGLTVSASLIGIAEHDYEFSPAYPAPSQSIASPTDLAAATTSGGFTGTQVIIPAPPAQAYLQLFNGVVAAGGLATVVLQTTNGVNILITVVPSQTPIPIDFGGVGLDPALGVQIFNGGAAQNFYVNLAYATVTL